MQKERKKTKKAQIGIMEIAVILIAMALLFSLIFIFYGKLKFSEIKKISNEIDNTRADSLLNKISSMPEFRCSLSFKKVSEINCIDELKLAAYYKFRNQYSDSFSGLKEARIERVFPLKSEVKDKECRFTINYPEDCGYWILYEMPRRVTFGSVTSEKKQVDTPISLCIQKGFDVKCEIGKLILTVDN